MCAEKERKLTIKEKALRYKHKHRGMSLGRGLVALILLVLLMLLVSGRSLTSLGTSPAADGESNLLQSRSNLLEATFVGDINLSNGEERLASVAGVSSIFSKTKDSWANSDLVLGNLESVLLEEGEKYKSAKDGSNKLGTKSDFAKGLKDAGFTALSLANDHSADYEKKGLKSTLSALDSVGIETIGAGENSSEAADPLVKDVNGIKIAVYTMSDVVPEESAATVSSPGIATASNSDLFMNIYKMRESVDLIVVNVHWGYEYTSTESKEQQELAHDLVEAGADVVVGEHSHTLQPIEMYQGKLIVYGLGDYSHDNAWTRTKDGAMLHLVVDSQHQVDARLQFIRIEGGIPTTTVGDFYIDRDTKIATQHLDKLDYSLDGSTLTIPLGNLGDNYSGHTDEYEEEAQQND
jgi:poly-gamma-glutamate synthesis protein (capsule biosynthesis protein)